MKPKTMVTVSISNIDPNPFEETLTGKPVDLELFRRAVHVATLAGDTA
jgi:hypothetical protein